MLRLAKTAFLLLIFSLSFMKPAIFVGGLAVTATDAIFIITCAALAAAVATGETRLRWNSFYSVLLFYFTALLISLLGSAEPQQAALKLASQAYLLALPVLACTLVDSRDELRSALRCWLAASAIVGALGAVAVAFFFLGIGGPLLEFARHDFGTLPPGPYLRVESTFPYPAMLCNYLTVSLMVLLVSHRLGWIGAAPFRLLLALIVATALFSLTPGLGGIFLAIGLWLFIRAEDRSRPLALVALAAGAGAALLFVLAATVTPIVHPTAPFLIRPPGLDLELAPSVRMMTWIDSWSRFSEHWLTGTGIGTDAAAVRYVDPSGYTHWLTDAHNVFLNLAVQCGLLGIAGLALLIFQVGRLTRPLRGDGDKLIALGLGLAWLNAFAYQGLTGSYEDARHLWVLLGLFLVAVRVAEPDGARAPAPTGRP